MNKKKYLFIIFIILFFSFNCLTNSIKKIEKKNSLQTFNLPTYYFSPKDSKSTSIIISLQLKYSNKLLRNELVEKKEILNKKITSILKENKIKFYTEKTFSKNLSIKIKKFLNSFLKKGKIVKVTISNFVIN